MIDGANLLTKLQVKPGMRLRLVNVPQQFAEALAAHADVVRPGEAFGGAIVFCANRTEVASFAAQVVPGLPPDGLLWFAYRKGAAAKASGLSRDVGWEAVKAQGYDTVRSIAFDDDWTGLRFRHGSVIKPSR